MTAAIIVLEPVPWYVPADDMPSYRTCDQCGYDVIDEVVARKPEGEWRQFFRLHGGCDAGLVLCEECWGKYLAEEVSYEQR